jgi:hypothetical protein
MSMVFALARQSVEIVAKSTPEHDYYKMVMEAVDKRQIDRAINENRYLLAYQNYKQLLPVMDQIVQKVPNNCVAFTHPKEFKFFVTKKMDYWFPKDPLKHWMELNPGNGNGWESFITKTVPKKMSLMNRILDVVKENGG